MHYYTLESRKKIEVNTDPQRRCYNGCHAKSEFVHTKWESLLVNVPEDELDYQKTWWEDLNYYAVKERGEGARREFRAVEENIMSDRIKCKCGKGYASEVDNLCRFCRETTLRRAESKNAGVRHRGDGLTLDQLDAYRLKQFSKL